MNSLDSYLLRLKKLRVDGDKVDGIKVESPYKPALLLAVIEGIEENLILDNRIEITPELIAGFKAYCHLLQGYCTKMGDSSDFCTFAR